MKHLSQEEWTPLRRRAPVRTDTMEDSGNVSLLIGPAGKRSDKKSTRSSTNFLFSRELLNRLQWRDKERIVVCQSSRDPFSWMFARATSDLMAISLQLRRRGKNGDACGVIKGSMPIHGRWPNKASFVDDTLAFPALGAVQVTFVRKE